MREFAYRNDGIPRDVIQPRPSLPSFRMLTMRGRHTNEVRQRQRERERQREEEKRIKNLIIFLNCAYKYPSFSSLIRLNVTKFEKRRNTHY